MKLNKLHKVNILNLGKDLLGKLINQHLDPEAALNCLFVCKTFNKYLDREKAIKNYLIYLNWLDHKDFIENNIICKECCMLVEKSKYALHLVKHKKAKEGGKKTFIYTLPTSCQYCHLPFVGDNISHRLTCRLKKFKCQEDVFFSQYPFIEVLCKKEFYIGEYPQHCKEGHVCKCKICNEVFLFKDTSSELDRHANICGKKYNIYSYYVL